MKKRRTGIFKQGEEFAVFEIITYKETKKDPFEYKGRIQHIHTCKCVLCGAIHELPHIRLNEAKSNGRLHCNQCPKEIVAMVRAEAKKKRDGDRELEALSEQEDSRMWNQILCNRRMRA